METFRHQHLLYLWKQLQELQNLLNFYLIPRHKVKFFKIVNLMKFSRLLVPFLAFCILNSSLSSSFTLKISQNDKLLSNSVCKIIKDISKSKTDTQDILIGNLGGNLWTSTINDITGCIGSDNSVVISNFKAALKEENLRKAAVIVMMLSDVSEVRI